MEFLSMPHTHTSTLHLIPRPGDTLVSNLRAPLLTVVEDTSPGVHDTLIAACDPLRYKELGVEKWEEHGSCAENLVMALKDINEKSGLKGARSIGADVTVNNVPAPLNLFMNVPWYEEGVIKFEAPKEKRGGYVKFKAERDVVVVMSACPQDVSAVNGKKCMVAHFMVEEPGKEGEAKKEGAKKEGERKPKPPKLRQKSSEQQAQSKSTGKSDAKADVRPEAKPAAKSEAKPDKQAQQPMAQEKKPAPKKEEAKEEQPEKAESKEQPKSQETKQEAPKEEKKAQPQPKKDEPKKEEPKQEEPKKDEPKKDETAQQKQAAPETPKKQETGQDSPTPKKKPKKLEKRSKPASEASSEK